MTLETMLKWQDLCQWTVIIGGILVSVAGGGMKYFEGKISEARMAQQQEMIKKEISGIPARQQLFATAEKLQKKRNVSRNQQRGIRGH